MKAVVIRAMWARSEEALHATSAAASLSDCPAGDAVS